MLDLDAVVVGGGVIGLAVARSLSLRGREVTLLEAEPRLGLHTSSRSSEVIHAGIHYPEGSLKARLCVEGNRRLYEYCAERGVPHRRIGKLIVATRDDEVPELDRIWERARQAGVSDLEWLEPGAIAELEPAVRAVRGVFSPSTGIIDSHALLSALRADAEATGAQIVLDSPVLAGAITTRGIELEIGGAEPVRARCRTLVNAAGFKAQTLSRAIAGVPRESIPGQHFAKGHYFSLRGRAPFRHLVYPVPVPGGLGVHVTLDLAGQARFGPDLSWVEAVDYSFDSSREGAFYAAIRRYFPALASGALVPGYTGIRPKLSPPGSKADDFLVQGPRAHAVPGLLCLYGVESPGLTASLSLADFAVEEL